MTRIHGTGGAKLGFRILLEILFSPSLFLHSTAYNELNRCLFFFVSE
jgi:hypothetical protein